MLDADSTTGPPPDTGSPLPATIAGLEYLLRWTGGDPRIRVAVLDGPIAPHHPALNGDRLTNLAESHSAGGWRTPSRGPASLHGLQIASLLFGREDGPVRGLATGCTGLLVPVFRDGPADQRAACSQLDLADAISLAVAWGANIINISGGQLSETGRAHPLLARVVEQAAKQGVLIVAAAGNDGCPCLHVPASLPAVLAVGSLDQSGQPLTSSNWGPDYRDHAILAPGEQIRVADWNGGVAWASGTSYSAALVSGMAALLMSVEIGWGLRPDGRRTRGLLLDTSEGCDEDEITCRRWLAGKLDLRRALGMLFLRSSQMKMQLGDSSPLGGQGSISDLGEAAPGGASPAPSYLVTPSQVPAAVGAVASAQIDAPASSQRTAAAAQLRPQSASDCGCGCGGAAAPGPPRKVFALGRLSLDFGTQARRDSIGIHMQAVAPSAEGPQQPENLAHLLRYLEREPYEAESLTWTLNLDETPLYAIAPAGPFADRVFLRLREFLAEQREGQVSMVSVPGVIDGQVRLRSGQMVPVIRPVLRGMFSWDVDALIDHVLREALPAAEPEAARRERLSRSVANFLHRVYFEMRNLGTMPQDRALNYAATNALLVADTYESALNDELELDTIEVEPSQICRPESECWDIKLYFFNPRRETVSVRRVFRFTVDVSDLVPVMVGSVRSWSAR